MTTASRPEFPRLAENERADVCVVGAGIAGLSTAYLLTRAGKSVIVLDDGPIVSGETERTTAHLVNALDDRFFELERLHGEKGARLAAESHTAAVDTIERLVREEGIDCDFARVDGYLFNGPDGFQRSWIASCRRRIGRDWSIHGSWTARPSVLSTPDEHFGFRGKRSFIP